MSDVSTPGVGPVEAAFVIKLNTIISGVKKQVSENARVVFEEEINKEIGKILAEEFNNLVAIISSAKHSSSFRYSNYTYPMLSDFNQVEKVKRLKYSRDGDYPFKDKRFKKNYSSSLVGIMKALADHADAGQLMMNAFGASGSGKSEAKIGSIFDTIKDKDTQKAFREKAEAKKKELMRKRKLV